MGKLRNSETCKSRKARTTPFLAPYARILKRLIEAREDAGLNQRDVSARMGHSHSFLSKCETGDRRIDVMELLQSAEIYGKPLQFFFD
jgi:transcriptional regulator with XRE-family HTH domain